MQWLFLCGYTTIMMYIHLFFFCVTMLATCCQMLCHFDTLADMKIGRVGDMADNMSPTCCQHTHSVCKSGHETTQHKTTFPAKAVPMLQAAHYLYYQRVEQDPEGDTVASGGGGGGNAPSSSLGGRGAAGSRLEVKFNYVVYEGKMQDGMRDGYGICLYNNNNVNGRRAGSLALAH